MRLPISFRQPSCVETIFYMNCSTRYAGELCPAASRFRGRTAGQDQNGNVALPAAHPACSENQIAALRPSEGPPLKLERLRALLTSTLNWGSSFLLMSSPISPRRNEGIDAG